MASKEELKAIFVTGAKPTEENFHDLIDLAGEPGPQGKPGKDGEDGKDGRDGEDGILQEFTNTDLNEVIGADFFDGGPYNATEILKREIISKETKSIDSMSSAFSDHNSSTIDLSAFDTSNVLGMDYMFSGSSIETLDLSNFNTSNVRNMSGMFFEMSELVELDVSSFDTSNVHDMIGMFRGVELLEELDLSSFDVTNVTHMSDMFTQMFSCQVIYARTEADKARFEDPEVNSLGIPVEVKS